jgi:glycosyltransferase involved in cell wall biosynthesis
MRLLFLHQNFPGQFRHLARLFAGDKANDVVFVTQKDKPDMAGVRKLEYTPHRKVTKGIHHYLASTEAAVINGQAVARLLIGLKGQGWIPDAVIGHPGWGETLFVKDVYPEAPLISFCEFYYRGTGSDVGFDPEFPATPDAKLRARTRAGYHLLALEAADHAYAPTEWQKSQFPTAYLDKIEVIHDGIDTAAACPDAKARFALPGGRVLGVKDEVITYVARNLEPYRGFHVFMRALPDILRRRPRAQVIVVGGDEVSYGSKPADGRCWRETLLAETGLASDRVHFVGRVPYTDYLRILQISSAHVYLTYPFVLSWSVLEAMAAGALVIASRTPPVEEVIGDGVNGLLVDFFDPAALAEKVDAALSDPVAQVALRKRARQTVVERFALADCLERQSALIRRALRMGAT